MAAANIASGTITGANIAAATIAGANIAAGTVAASNLVSVIGGAWVAYTPTWTSAGTPPAIGNGTLVGKYWQLGKTIGVRISLIAGSTTTFGNSSNAWTFALPNTARGDSTNQIVSGFVQPGSGLYYNLVCVITSGGGTLAPWVNVSGTAQGLISGGTLGFLGPSTTLAIEGIYEAL